jgi:molecular chaperone HscB
VISNYFTLFDLPTVFPIDENLLQQRYGQLQRQFHPDRCIHTSALEKLQAQQQSADINAAYQTLRDPLKRGFHLVEILGGTLPSYTTTDASILIESMEQREALEEAETPLALQHLLTENTTLQNAAKTAIAQAFAAHHLEKATTLLLRLQYLTKFAADIARKQESLNDVTANS